LREFGLSPAHGSDISLLYERPNGSVGLVVVPWNRISDGTIQFIDASEGPSRIEFKTKSKMFGHGGKRVLHRVYLQRRFSASETGG